MTRRDIHGALVAVAISLFASSAHAQELRIYGVQAGSSQQTLSDAGGFGISGVIAPSPWLRVEGGFITVGRGSERSAIVCASYIPRGNCRTELLTEHYTVRSFRLAYAPMVLSREMFGLALKAGLSISQIVSDSRPETERMSNLQHPRTGQDGRFLGAQLSFVPVRRLPVSVNVGAISQWVDFTGCQEYDFQFAPFCGVDRFDELQVGAAVLLGR